MAPQMSMSGKKASAPGFFERLQPRERMLVMALALVFFLMANLVLFMVRMTRTDEIDAEIADARAALELLQTEGADYEQRLADKARREASIADTELQFSMIIEQAEALAEVKVGNQEVKKSIDITPELRQRVVTFDLRSVTLEQLTKFLAAVEDQDGRVVLTQSLLIRSPSAEEDRLNVDVEVATWERVAPLGAPAEGTATP